MPNEAKVRFTPDEEARVLAQQDRYARQGVSLSFNATVKAACIAGLSALEKGSPVVETKPAPLKLPAAAKPVVVAQREGPPPRPVHKPWREVAATYLAARKPRWALLKPLTDKIPGWWFPKHPLPELPSFAGMPEPPPLAEVLAAQNAAWSEISKFGSNVPEDMEVAQNILRAATEDYLTYQSVREDMERKLGMGGGARAAPVVGAVSSHQTAVQCTRCWSMLPAHEEECPVPDEEALLKAQQVGGAA